MDNPSDKEASLHKPHEAAALAVHTASTEILFWAFVIRNLLL
jgi:hypothetical protein